MTSLVKEIKPISSNGDYPFINVVSGLPRSGTSMMMQMLKSAGMDIVSDNQRKPDKDNPKGYFEFEKVKQLQSGKNGWLSSAQGKAVKIVSTLLKNLPIDHEYKIIFMQRDLDEVILSQKKMLSRNNKAAAANESKLKKLFSAHLADLQQWLPVQPNIEVINVSYNELLSNPSSILPGLESFLEHTISAEQMVKAIDRNLYRNRNGDNG